MNRNNKNYAQAAAQSKTHNNNTHHQNQQHHHQQVSQQNQTSGNSTSSNFSSSANGKAINKSKPQAQHNSTMGNGNTGRSTSIKQKNPVQLPMNGHAWEKKTTIEFGSINTPNAQISSSTSTGPALTSGGGLPTTLPTKGGPTFGTLNTTTQTTQATQAIPTTVGTSGPGANNNNSNNNSNNNNNNGVAHKPISARAGEIPRTHSAPPQIQDNNRNVGQSNYLSNVPATRAIHQQQQSTVVSHQQPSASVSNTPLNHRKDSVSSTVSSNDGQPPFHPHHSPHHAHNTHHHYGRHHNHKPNMGPPNQYRPRDNKNVTHPSPHLNPAQSVSTQGVPMAGPQMWPPQYSMQMPPFYGYPPVHNVHNPMFIPQHTYAMQPRPPIQQPHLTQVPTVNYKPPNISTKKSQAIEIIDPNKNAPIQYVKQQQSQLSKSPHKREEAPPAVFDKKPEESDKEKPSSDDKGISRAVPIVDPAERERKEREEQERITKEKADQERKEREEKERVAKEKEEQERREREERERKEREEKERIAKEKEEQERREREERERKEREERERKEREERERKEREERERKEREERERKEREEQERIAKEKAEQERKEREEKERIAKEKAEQERKEREEKERIAKEKEEQERREREEREKREREEKERIAKEEQERKEREEKERIEKEEKERKEAEKARKEQEEKEEIERKKKEEEEARIKATAEDDEKKKEKEAESNDSKKEEKKYGKGHRPGPLDLSRTTSAPAIPSAPLSALGSARAIDDINSVQYPEGISSPNPALNSNAEPGKFKYDRSFLMQFMGVCKEKPENLPALEAIGMEEPKDDKRNKRPSVSRSNSSMHKNSPQFPMGEFKFPPKTSEERFAVSNMRNGSPVMFGGRTSLSRTGSGSTLLPAPAMSGTPSSPSRTSSGRGTTRKGGKHHMQLNNLGEPVAPLERSENRWVPGLDPALHKTTEGIIPIDSVKRKVKALLNKLTLEKFDSISDQIVDYANKSRDEKDGRILREVIRLIFEKSCDESNFCAMYAQLCRKMMERVDPEIVDENVKNTEGKFVQGGTLFRKYLLNRCQEDFEKGWKVNIPVPSNEKGEPDLMSDEYYVAAKAKRQGLGLIRFIGELFKLNMLTERIMHECIKKLLIFQGSPEEEEMESLCKLMNTVGEQLDHVKTNQHEHIKANQIDHAKAKQLMESYFARMDEISKLPNLSSRIKFMIMDVIDLRSNAWKPRRDINAPKTIAEIHEDAAKQKEEAEFLRRSASSGGKLPKISEQMSRSGSGRRDHKGMTHGSPGNDGWINVGGNSSQRKDKVGDLTKFGSVSRGKITGNNFSLAPGGLPLSGGAKGWKSDNKDRDDKTTVLSRTNSTSNMYSVLTAESSEGRKSSESSTSEVQKPSPPTERKRIILAPRTKAITPEEPHSADKPAPKSNSEATSSVQSIPDESIKKINNMMEEYFSVLDIQEVLQCLKEIPAEHHARAIESFANKVLEKKQKDVDNVTKLFKEIVSSGTCDVITFKSGFKATLDFLMDIGADAPMSYSFTGQLMFGAGLDFRDITKLLTSLDDDKSIEKIVRGYTSALKNDDEQKYVQKINEFDFKTLFPKKNKDDINKYLEDLGLGSSKK